MHYDFLWFDLGYTLLYKKREGAYRNILKDFGVEKSEEEIAKAFHLADKRFMRDYPGILSTNTRFYSPWYLATANYFLSIQIELCELSARWVANREKENPLWYPYPEAKEVLLSLKSSYRLGVISNWDCSAKTILKQNGLLSLFDACIISSEVGVEKPKEEIFNIALKEGKTEASSSLYIGDNYYDDAVGAAKIGMKAVIINRFGRLGIEEISGVDVISGVKDLSEYLEK